ncbi:MAG TPA: UbiA family prenyltransferase [Gemmatimonadaceae bacterium]|nr:UbiA family prenyltransferase [Gemmatimonadaceae bacterium]
MSGPAPAESWRGNSRARRLGYALLPGDAFSYVLHLRPREWPIMTAHTALGVLLALFMGDAPIGARPETVVAGALAVAVWVVLLNGGTLALNSAFDRDEGDIGYLDAPPPPPRRLAAFGVGLMVAGQAIALALPRTFALLYGICFIMSVLYSVPPVRLKAVAGADWLINVVGFGMLTPLAGWAATGRPLEPAALWIFAGFGALFAALYPLTQLYQFDEDRSRGDRTLAIVIGVRASLVVALVAAVAAFAGFAAGIWAVDPAPRRLLALVPALAAWVVVLGRWLARYERMDRAAHKRGMYAALAAWAVTDAAILAAVWRW